MSKLANVFLFICLGAALLSADAFQNGGFESPVITGLDFATIPTGWVKVDPSCGTNCSGGGLFMQLYSTFSLPTTGGEGTQAFGFGGNGVTTGSLSQTFDTIAGDMYELSFQYVIQQGSGFEDWTVDLLNGASTLATKSQQFNTQDWVTTTLDFTAGSTSTLLRFTDTSGLNESPGDHFSTNWALDAVKITDLGSGSGPSPVPEPRLVWLLGLSVAALAGYRRVRLAKVSS